MSENQTPTGPAAETAGAAVYWRSIAQLEDAPGFQEMMHREFPEGITEPPGTDEVSRRSFLSAIAASVALAGLTGCRKPKTRILPFNRRPEGFKPGMPQFYATTLTRRGYGIGVVVKSSDGRPTKIEGNELHPASLGGTDQFLQGELLNLYDPGRSQTASGPDAAAPAGDGHGQHGAAATAVPGVFERFDEFWQTAMKDLHPKKGAGLRILMPPTASPTLLGMVEQVRGTFPEARFHTWEPLHRDAEAAGSVMAFGRALETHVDYSKADAVVALDCDFLGLDGQNLRNARAWADRRRAPQPGQQIPRLYAVEAGYSVTGTMADHRFRVRAQELPGVVFALAAALGVGQGADLGAALQAHKEHAFTSRGRNWIDAVAKDLQARNGRCAVVVGPRAPAAVHAVAHAINAHLGSIGTAVTFTDLPPSLAQGRIDSIRELARDIDSGSVQVLVCLGTNPVYDAPADLQFARLLGDKKVAHTIHVGLYRDETARLCQWHFNQAHELESWGDARAADGTVSLRQPLIAPLFGGVSLSEFLAILAAHPVIDLHPLWRERSGAAGYELVRAHWQANSGAVDFEGWWTKALHDGVVAGSASAPVTPTIAPAGIVGAVRAWTRPSPGSVNNLELVLRADSKMLDGRYANNSWMQELPDPLTKLTWDNAALLSVKTAAELGVANGDLLNLGAEGSSTVVAPAWILPGHADYSITLTLGYGRDLPAECKVAKGAGVNAYALRTSDRQSLVTGVRGSRAGGSYLLASTQDHGTMAGRAIVREQSADGYAKDPEWAPKMSLLDKAARLKGKTEADINKSLWPERGYHQGSDDPAVAASPYQWGMVIDLNACTGCAACVIACTAENNIPMVGKQQVARGREMFWLRTDRYFASVPGDDLVTAEDPQVSHMPLPCMQCENAPCESVCPVAATTHSPDGLNDMVYNRCIGTRYCSNNCPYKVRRFNYFDYIGHVPETKKMAFNPDVTVRSRGVMEKCTYCVQRINGARIHAKLEKRLVRDGEIATACSQACPTRAITFGNILDQDSAVSRLRASPLNYGVLSDLNTKPRTTYLGRIRNPNPELA